MSKLTFRADEDLIDRVEALEASKSDVMRAALRQYLDTVAPDATGSRKARHRSLDAFVAERVDTLVKQHLAERHENVGLEISPPRELTRMSATAGDTSASLPPAEGGEEFTTVCSECGEPLSSDHDHCPSCGERASTRLVCDCGNELQTDWSFCPDCGRRTPAAETPGS